MGDVFINRAGWTSTEYVKLMGGWVVVFTIVGQLLGGFLGDNTELGKSPWWVGS